MSNKLNGHKPTSTAFTALFIAERNDTHFNLKYLEGVYSPDLTVTKLVSVKITRFGNQLFPHSVRHLLNL
ncbi:unnamed protein product [Hermetia illucens]|uniref:Uncharacterized protein n=1 Tax=Hermetia illucens TaxID=343691 RepID=A0A7R8V9G4_HERIL|nr:unnamed protein product [Hermetia illucens]